MGGTVIGINEESPTRQPFLISAHVSGLPPLLGHVHIHFFWLSPSVILQAFMFWQRQIAACGICRRCFSAQMLFQFLIAPRCIFHCTCSSCFERPIQISLGNMSDEWSANAFCSHSNHISLVLLIVCRWCIHTAIVIRSASSWVSAEVPHLTYKAAVCGDCGVSHSAANYHGDALQTSKIPAIRTVQKCQDSHFWSTFLVSGLLTHSWWVMSHNVPAALS